MTVYADIVEWSRCLPVWQRDALRRLATQSVLSSAEIDELTVACLEEANQRPFPKTMIPIDSCHVPSGSSGNGAVAITSIGGCQSLNKITDGQTLTFGPSGLTIVYGDNGAGKSGFARVVRQVCSARGVADEILPDVYAPKPGKPQASVQYIVDGEAHSFDWCQGASPPDELRAVAIFDTVADWAFVENENEIFWTPGGLDLLIRLPKVMDQVRQQLEAQTREISTQGSMPSVPSGTAAATFISQLTATTNAAAMDGHMPKADDQDNLKRIAAILNTPDPAAEAGRIRQQVQRFRALKDRLTLLEGRLGRAGIEVLDELHSAYKAAVDAEAVLARDTFKDTFVAGAGGAAWQALWTAAERFALSGATTDGKFPSGELPGRCVLCQQEIDDDARVRLDRFHAFVRSDLAQRRQVAAEAVRAKIEAVRLLRTREPVDESLLEELAALDKDNAAKLGVVLAAADGVKSTIVALVPGDANWGLPSPLPEGWAAWLGGICDDAEKRAATMLGAANPSQQATLRAQQDEILARQAFADSRALVEAEVKRLVRRAEVDRALAACNTHGISRKAGEMARAHVSERLMKAFTDEALALKVPAQVSYAYSRNDKGTSYQRLALGVAKWTAAGPKQVLSEGERRSVALAAFFAELESRSDSSAVVFDDPVSSLDHGRRELVAKRLSKLAQNRQVVVLTHDLVFHHMMRAQAGNAGIAISEREVGRLGALLGLCRSKPPVRAMHVKALIGELNDCHQRCVATYQRGCIEEYSGQVSNAFQLLRNAWEVAVEELLLNGTVRRFDHCVHTQQLEPLHDISQADIAEINTGMTECSKWLHAVAAAVNLSLPGPADLRAEIDRLDRFRIDMRGRGRR